MLCYTYKRQQERHDIKKIVGGVDGVFIRESFLLLVLDRWNAWVAAAGGNTLSEAHLNPLVFSLSDEVNIGYSTKSVNRKCPLRFRTEKKNGVWLNKNLSCLLETSVVENPIKIEWFASRGASKLFVIQFADDLQSVGRHSKGEWQIIQHWTEKPYSFQKIFFRENDYIAFTLLCHLDVGG